MKKIFLLVAVVVIIADNISAQVSVSNPASAPDPSAMLDVKSANKGMLIPRMSSDARKAIANPAVGLLVFDSTQKTLYMFDGKNWLGFPAMTDNQRPANNFVYAPVTSDTTLMGYSVSMWDQFAAIGAPLVGSDWRGAVYIYRNLGSGWQYFSTLTPTGIVDTAEFGASVNIKGNYLIVGAPTHKNGSSQRVGAAYIYNFNSTSWVSQQTIFGSVGGNQYGSAVAISQFGTYAAVSEPYATVTALTGAGIVNIYNKPVSTFVFQAALNDANPVASENFGSAMAMNAGGNNILVGAPSKLVGGHYSNGYVGQFDRSGSTWPQIHTYTPISEDGLAIGRQVDITDQSAMWTVGKTKTVNVVDLGWTGYEIPPFDDDINGISIDPTSESTYVFSGNAIYALNSSTPSKIKTLGIDITSLGLTQLLSVFNKNFVAGIPYGINSDKIYTGGAYFGLSPQ